MKKVNQRIFVLLGILFSTYGCTTLNTKTSQVSSYSENISGLRPKFETYTPDKPIDTVDVNEPDQQVPALSNDISENLNQMLESSFKRNEDIDYVNGYTIQVYSGSSRENANMVKTDIYKYIPNAKPKEGFEAPNFKVRVGEFLEKIEAQRIYSEIKVHFPQAIVIPARIPHSSFSNK